MGYIRAISIVFGTIFFEKEKSWRFFDLACITRVCALRFNIGSIWAWWYDE